MLFQLLNKHSRYRIEPHDFREQNPEKARNGAQSDSSPSKIQRPGSTEYPRAQKVLGTLMNRICVTNDPVYGTVSFAFQPRFSLLTFEVDNHESEKREQCWKIEKTLRFYNAKTFIRNRHCLFAFCAKNAWGCILYAKRNFHRWLIVLYLTWNTCQLINTSHQWLILRLFDVYIHQMLRLMPHSLVLSNILKRTILINSAFLEKQRIVWRKIFRDNFILFSNKVSLCCQSARGSSLLIPSAPPAK